MAVTGGPKLITSGLQYLMDPANKRCYPGSGTTVSDLGEFGFDGTLNGDPVFSTDNNGIFTMDGTGDEINLGSRNFGVSAGVTTEFTLTAWIYNTNTSVNAAYVDIGYESVESNAGQMMIYNSASSQKFIRFLMYDQNNTRAVLGNISSNVIENDTWHYIGARWKSSNGNVEGIFNGAPTGITITSSGVTSLNSRSQAVTIASNWAFLNGKIGPVNFYNRYLSDNEIALNYNNTRDRFGK